MEKEADRLAHRQPHDRRLGGAAGDRVVVVRVVVVVAVAERPLPLEAVDLHHHRRLVRGGLHGAEGRDAEDEQDDDDDGRDDGPDDLDQVVAVELGRQAVVAAAVAEDGVEDEALDAHEDDGRHDEDDHVEAERGLRLGRLRLRWDQAAAEQQRNGEQ